MPKRTCELSDCGRYKSTFFKSARNARPPGVYVFWTKLAAWELKFKPRKPRAQPWSPEYQPRCIAPPPARAPGPHAAHISRGPCPLSGRASPVSYASSLSGLIPGAAPHWEWAQRKTVEKHSVGAILQDSNAASRFRAPHRCTCPHAAGVRACMPPARPRVRSPALVRIPAPWCIRGALLPRAVRGAASFARSWPAPDLLRSAP